MSKLYVKMRFQHCPSSVNKICWKNSRCKWLKSLSLLILRELQVYVAVYWDPSPLWFIPVNHRNHDIRFISLPAHMSFSLLPAVTDELVKIFTQLDSLQNASPAGKCIMDKTRISNTFIIFWKFTPLITNIMNFKQS